MFSVQPKIKEALGGLYVRALSKHNQFFCKASLETSNKICAIPSTKNTPEENSRRRLEDINKAINHLNHHKPSKAKRSYYLVLDFLYILVNKQQRANTTYFTFSAISAFLLSFSCSSLVSTGTNTLPRFNPASNSTNSSLIMAVTMTTSMMMVTMVMSMEVMTARMMTPIRTGERVLLDESDQGSTVQPASGVLSNNLYP